MALILCLVSPFSLGNASTPNHFYELDIKQQALSSALIELAYQANISIIFDKSITNQIEAHPVKGSYTIRDALDKILSGKKIKYSFINEQTVSIQKCEVGNCMLNSPDKTKLRNINPILPTHRYLDEVITIGQRITGSRIKRNDINGSSAIDILSLEDIEISGAQSISDVLKHLPAVAGNSTSTFVTNGGDGTSSVALRGLPTSNTLVLVNGRRTASGGLKARATDLNIIPFSAIDRIEVLKEGASAIYGTDAIAGVVNIIMKDDYDGLNIETYYGSSDQSDLKTASVKFTFGHQFEQGDIIISGNGFDQGEIYSRDRKVSSDADATAQGGVNLRSSATPFPRITVTNEHLILEEGFDGSSSSHFRPTEKTDGYNYREQSYSYVPSTQKNLFLHGYFNLTHNTNVYLDSIYAQTLAKNQLAATPLTNFQGTDVTVSANNIYNPFNTNISDFRRRMTEFGPRLFVYNTVMRQVSFGIEKSQDHWSWDIGFNKSKNTSNEVSHNLLDAQRTQRALSDTNNCLGATLDGCVPLNVFGPPGSITAEQIDYLSANATINSFSTLDEISANMVGDLASINHGTVKLAAGYNHRQEAITIQPDEYTTTTNMIGGTSIGQTNGDRVIRELYLELLAPLYKNTSFGNGIELELAARYSDYSDFGDITNPKLGIKYYVNEHLLLRTTYSKGFRAPSMNELFSGEQQSFDQIEDPCSQQLNIATLPGCAQLADDTRSQFLTIKGGNPALLPEYSKNYTAGLVWNAAQSYGLSSTLDLYKIEQNNVVDSSAQFVVEQNAFFGLWSDRISRDLNGNLTQVNASFLNIGRREISGADITISYKSKETNLGQFKYALNAAYIKRYLDQIDPSAERINLAGSYNDAAAEGNGALPKWKFNLGLSWSKEFWLIAYTVHHVDAIEETIPNSLVQRKISSWTIHNAQTSTFLPSLLNTRLTFGVKNLFNKAPPFAASAFNDNIDARTYDLTGRFLYLKLSKEF